MLYDNPTRALAFVSGPFKELCTPAEMAEILHIDDSAIRQAIRSGRLIINQDCIQLGKQWLLSKHAWAVMGKHGGMEILRETEQKCCETIKRAGD